MVARGGRTYRNVRGDQVSLDPIGVGAEDTVRLIGGMDALVSSQQAAVQELCNAAKEMRILNERQFQMTGQHGTTQNSTVGDAQRALTEDLTSSLQQAVNQVSAALQDILPPSMRAAAPSPGNTAPPGILTPPGRTQSPASQRDMPDVEDLNGPAREDNPGRRTSEPRFAHPEFANSRQVFTETRDFLGGKSKLSLSNVRRGLGERMQESLANREPGPQMVTDEQGRLRHYDPEAEGGLGGYADDIAVAAFLRNERRQAALRGAAGTLAEGGTMRQAGLNLLPAGAARLAGGVGAAFYAADKIGDFAEGQRATNAEWQRISGGSNVGGFEERLRSQLFQFGQFGVMGEQEAARLYQGIAATGMGRDNRETAEQFAVDAYKQFGMTVEQSLEIISTAARTGQESLTGLAESLREVTDSAAEAGVNAEVARESFVNNWQTFSQVFMGPAATTMAQGFTQAQLGMGPRFQDLNLGGIASTQVMRSVGAANNMTLNEVLAQSMAPGGQADYTQMWTRHSQNMIGNMIGDQGQAIISRVIDQATPENGKFRGLTEQQSIQAMRELLQNNPNVDAEALISTISQLTGVQGLNLNNVMDYATQVMSGDFNPAREVREQERQMNRRSRTRTLGEGGKLTAGGGGIGLDYISEYGTLADKVRSDVSWKPWDDARQMTGAFLEDVRETKRAGGISQAIAMADTAGIADVTSVQVQTEDGPRVVSIEDAMRHFRDQIDAGTAQVVEGNKAGVSVADAMQLKGDKRVKVTSTKDEDLADKGESLADWRKENGQGGGGNVTITPAPELMRFLRFQTSGGVNLDPSAALMPPPPHVNAYGRPTGSAD